MVIVDITNLYYFLVGCAGVIIISIVGIVLINNNRYACAKEKKEKTLWGLLLILVFLILGVLDICAINYFTE